MAFEPELLLFALALQLDILWANIAFLLLNRNFPLALHCMGD